MIKRFDPRIVLGLVLLLGGVVLMLENLGILENATDWFWGALFLAAAAAFVVLLFGGHWWAAFPAMTLLALGVTVLLPESLDDFGGLTFLGGIGLAFWLVYFMDRSRWWALIPAGVLTTLAVISALPDRVAGMDSGGFLFVGLAITFLLVALLAGMRWAYWPAAALGVLGLLITASMMNFANYLWAVALIIAGVYMILRYFTKRELP